MSASSKTMTGALPPSSRCTRLTSRDGALGHLHAGADRAGDRDERRRRVLDEHAAGLAVAGDDVEGALGQELRGELGEEQRRLGRRVGRLEDDGVARGEGRGDLPHRHHHRVVPRRHLADDTDRLAAHERGVPLHVLPRGLALEHPRGAGEEAQLVEHRRDLLAPRSARAACRCSRPRGATKSSARASMASAIFSSAAGAPRGVVSPHVSNAVDGGGVGRVDVGLAADRSRGDDRAVDGSTMSRVVSAVGVDVLAADEVAQAGAARCEAQAGMLDAYLRNS